MKQERVFGKLREPCSIIGSGVVENSCDSIALVAGLERSSPRRDGFRFFNRCRRAPVPPRVKLSRPSFRPGLRFSSRYIDRSFPRVSTIARLIISFRPFLSCYPLFYYNRPVKLSRAFFDVRCATGANGPTGKYGARRFLVFL